MMSWRWIWLGSLTLRAVFQGSQVKCIMMPWFHRALASAALKALPVAQLSNHSTLAGVTPYRLTVPEGISVGLVWRKIPRYLVDASAAAAPRVGTISAALTNRP